MTKDLFMRATPESVGVPSSAVLDFIATLDEYRMHTHSIIMARGENIFAECYYKPFDENFLHRMYSQTKSYSAIAIGLLEEEGKLSLDERLVDIFPDKIDGEAHEYLKEQTVRQIAQQRGVDLDQLAHQMGVRLPK